MAKPCCASVCEGLTLVRSPPPRVLRERSGAPGGRRPGAETAASQAATSGCLEQRGVGAARRSARPSSRPSGERHAGRSGQAPLPRKTRKRTRHRPSSRLPSRPRVSASPRLPVLPSPRHPAARVSRVSSSPVVPLPRSLLRHPVSPSPRPPVLPSSRHPRLPRLPVSRRPPYASEVARRGGGAELAARVSRRRRAARRLGPPRRAPRATTRPTCSQKPAGERSRASTGARRRAPTPT